MRCLTLACCLLAASCGDDAETPDAAPAPDAAPLPDAAPASSRVRVAHLSPDAPAVDVCLAAHGSGTFTSPVLAGAGAAAGLSYSTVTKYLDVPAAQYDVRIVAPGSTSCATSLAGLPDFTALPALPAGGSVTIAAEGLVAGGANPFALRAYIDDTAVAAGKAKLRLIHASPGTPAVDVGVGSGTTFTPVFTNVAFGATIATGNGYVETAPLSAVELSARANGTTTDVLSINPASLPAGAIATAFAIGVIGNATTPLRVLLCVDSAAPVGLLGACNVVGAAPSAALR